MQEFWRQYEAVPFTKNRDKYLRFSPEALTAMIMEELFESHAAPERHYPSVHARHK